MIVCSSISIEISVFCCLKNYYNHNEAKRRCFSSSAAAANLFAAWPRYVAAAYWMNVAVIQPSSSTETHSASYFIKQHIHMFVKRV
jgi:hypothetical protein